jgi:TonB family protein
MMTRSLTKIAALVAFVGCTKREAHVQGADAAPASPREGPEQPTAAWVSSDASVEPASGPTTADPAAAPLPPSAPRQSPTSGFELIPLAPIAFLDDGGVARGMLSESDAKRAVHLQASQQLRSCYQTGLTSNPDLAGRVVAKLVISASGVVTEASDAESDLPDPGVRQCVLRALSRVKFPPPKTGPVTIVYPFRFDPR